MSCKLHHFFSMESSSSLSNLLLLLSLLLLLFNIPHSHSYSFNSTIQPKCREFERNALLEFKAAFYNDSCIHYSYSMGDLRTWMVEGRNGDCCYWDGVECDQQSGHVTGLHLSDSCLSGSINSSSSIFKLTHLQTLDLSFSDFRYSKIPSAISNLSRLESLRLYASYFSGQIPLGILNLTNLSYLDLSVNQLTLKNPSLSDLVQSLMKLNSLSLHHVEISSFVPDSLSRLTDLRDLGLTGCKLQGQLPPSLSNLTNLEAIFLDNNQLTGEIFPHLLGLSQLQFIVFSSNKLSGEIPRTISHLKHLAHLHLDSNNFSGETHLHLLFQLESLDTLDLSYNNFSFIIDSSNKPKSKLSHLGLASCNLRSFPLLLQSQDVLDYLDLSSNDISGEVPQWFMDVCMENIHFLNISHNHLSGLLPIPSTNSLQYYFVSNNEFSGELPMRMCDLVNLEVFDVGNNNLGSMIPHCLAHLVGMGSLSVINLRNNNFSGPIPQVGIHGCNLMMIDMSYNRLEGTVPREMENCSNLEFLNLGNNRIIDVFPFWLGKLPTLSMLILHSNRFHGTIGKPPSGFEFPKLQIIDLSNNSFTGYLPAQYIKGLRAMKIDAHKEDGAMSYASNKNQFHRYFFTVTVNNKGITVVYTKIPETLVGLDLSSNHFTGEIPKSITTLKGLHFLNLSNNMFIGSIPSSLNGLTNLESLDLSHNKLSGEIPQQLIELTTLEFFDVSFNQLSGPIPQSKQFNTFENSSYQGNLGLCGLPLSRKCGNIIDTSPLPSPERDQASKTWIEFDWKIVSMGYTSGFVIGMVAGMKMKRGCKRVKRVRQIKFVLN